MTYQLDIEPTKSKRPYVVEGHESRLGQVVSNILQNAQSFSPDGGVITAGLVEDRKWLTLTIADEGGGIRPGQEKKIFKRFYTDRPTLDEFGQNSGLGLSISKQIIDAHGGSITVENIQNDDGSVGGAKFSIQLPK